MSNTTSPHGPSPTASPTFVRLDQHQPQPAATVGVADPSPPGSQQAFGPDLTTVLLLALFFAIVATAFWKVLIKVAIVAGLTLVFAGILVSVMMLAPPR